MNRRADDATARWTDATPVPADGATDAADAARVTRDLRRALARQTARLMATRRLVLLGEQLARSRSVSAVLEAVVEHAPAVAGTHRAIAYHANGAGLLLPHAPREHVRGLPPLSIELLGSGHGQALYTRPGLSRAPAGLRPLLVLLGPPPHGRLACVDIGTRGLLVLLERRADHYLGPEQWYHLGCIARQADAALERVTLTSGRPAP